MKYYSDISVKGQRAMTNLDRGNFTVQSVPRVILFRELFAASSFGRFVSEQLGVSYYVDCAPGINFDYVGEDGDKIVYRVTVVGRVVFNCSDDERVLLRLKGDYELKPMK